jgi:hypothetical protein
LIELKKLYLFWFLAVFGGIEIRLALARQASSETAAEPNLLASTAQCYT